MRGFITTAAAMVFAFTIITATYTFFLVSGDLSTSAMSGRVVESTRWAVEADNYKCLDQATAGSNVYRDEGIGYVLVEITNGNRASITDYDLGFMEMDVHLRRNYPPRVHLWNDTNVPASINWTACDVDDEGIVEYTVTWVNDTCPPELPCAVVGITDESFYPFSSGNYTIWAEDEDGQFGYSRPLEVKLP